MIQQNLIELDFKGSRFTWHNRQARDVKIQARLDRALVTPEWRTLYENTYVIHENFGASNYRPLITCLNCSHSTKRRSFKFELKWNKEDTCKEIIRQVWERDKSMGNEKDVG